MIVDKKISAVIFGLETTNAKAEFIVPYVVGVSFTGDMNLYSICLNTSIKLFAVIFLLQVDFFPQNLNHFIKCNMKNETKIHHDKFQKKYF